MISHKCVCVWGKNRQSKSKYKLSLSNKYWCFRISRVAMPDFVTFFGSLRLVPDDLSFIVVVFFLQFVEAFASFVSPWSLSYMSYVYSILQATPFHFSGTNQTQKTQIECALVFPVIFMPKPIYMAVARGSPTHLLLLVTFSKSNGTLSIGPLLYLIAMSVSLRFLPPPVCDMFSNKSF